MLLSASFRADPRSATVLHDEQRRLKQYITAMRWAAARSPGVVVAENSGRESPEFLRALAAVQQAHRVEFCRSDDSQVKVFRGKGWGEARLIRGALETSPLLQSWDAFAKVTGRLRVLNLRTIQRAIRRARGRNPAIGFVGAFDNFPPIITNTQYFWARRDFYLQHLGSVGEEVNDDAGHYLEHAVAARLLPLAATETILVLRLPLIIEGVHGWSGQRVQSRQFQMRLALRQMMLVRRPFESLSEWVRRQTPPTVSADGC